MPTLEVTLEPIVHRPSAVHPTASLGPGTLVWTFATVGAGVQTGSHCAIGSAVYIGADSRLGDSVRIQHGVFLPNRSRVGDRVFIGPNATFTDDRHPVVNHPQYRAEPPIIEDDASIGAGAVVLPGVTIGRGAMVGAGAVVTKDVPPFAVVKGNPAC
jgi:UDP-2-acetamido-3-amino-2,3-dideoxy-glucuronate N-acetyltransferase